MSDAIPQAWLPQTSWLPGTSWLPLKGRRSFETEGMRLSTSPSLSTATLVKVCLALLMLMITVTTLFALVRSIATLNLAKPAAAAIAPATATHATTTNPTWIAIVKPVRIYNLEARDLAKLPLAYTARRLDTGNAREDQLDFGSWHGDQPSLRLTIRRDDARPSASLDTAIVRQAADIGLAVGRSTLPDTVRTRFGAFEIADVGATTAANAMDTKNAMACSGFRLNLAAPRLAIDGFACGTNGRPIPRKTLGCLIDRLDLASAGEDRALIDFFAVTDLRRDRNCDGMRLGPDVLHAAWLDDKTADQAPATDRVARHHRRARHRH